MKTKKYIIITAISFVLIVTALILLFVWVLPSMNKNKALKALEEGRKDDAVTLFADFSHEKREDLSDDVKDIVVYTANQYIDGQKSYEDMYKVMEAVEEIPEYGGFSADAFLRINVPKMVETYEEALKLYGDNGNNDQFKNKKKEFDDYRDVELNGNLSLTYNWSSSQNETYENAYETALDAELKKKYEDYTAGNINYAEINIAVDVARDLYFTDYGHQLANELYYDDYFRGRLEEIQKEYDEQKYFEVIDDVKYITNGYSQESSWSRWSSKFEELSKNAEEKAKTFYVEKALEYVNEGNTYDAENIMSQIKAYLGDDVDVSAIEAAIEEKNKPDWKKGYIQFMYDWQNNLANDMAIAASNGMMTAELYDPEAVTMADIDAKYVTLYDIDQDGTPEMFLRGTVYVAVYSFDGTKPIYTGYISPIAIGKKGEMIVGAQQDVEGTVITAEALIKYKNFEWMLDDAVAYATVDGQYVYITMDEDGNATRVEEDEFKEEQGELEAHITDQLPIGVEVDKFEDYINNY